MKDDDWRAERAEQARREQQARQAERKRGRKVAVRESVQQNAVVTPDRVLETLSELRRVRERVELEVLSAVGVGRDLRVTWADLGAALGVSPQAACKRYGSADPLLVEKRRQAAIARRIDLLRGRQ